MTSHALATLTQASADANAARLLSEHASSCLSVSRTSSGEWILSPANELTAAKLTVGIAALNDALRGGPVARIAASLMRLIAATRRPGWMDDETAAVYFDTLQEALHDYPVDCVEDACIQWRKGPNGEWWPAEAEIRRVCDRLFEPRRQLRHKANELLRNLEAEEETAERAKGVSAFASDRGRAFREEMRARMTPSRFEAYFHYAYIMFQGESTIIVSNMTAERVLTVEGADLLERLGLRVVYDPKPFVKVRRPQWEDDTPEERVEVTRKLNRLKEAMTKGEDLRRLRASGEI